MKYLKYGVIISLITACSSATTESLPTPSSHPSSSAQPSSIPNEQPITHPSQSSSPLPRPTVPSSPVPTSSPLPTKLYAGSLNENTQNSYLNYLYAQANGQGLALWYNSLQAGGHGGLSFKDFKTIHVLGGLPDLGPAVGHLDTNGNGLIAWHSALPANTLNQKPTQYLYTQSITNFQPVGSAKQEGVFQPLSVTLDEAGNGWLLLTDERPPIYGNQQGTATQYPDILHVQARQITDYALQSTSKTIFEMPYLPTMDHGYLDQQGNGFVVWHGDTTGLSSQLQVQALQNFAPVNDPIELSGQAMNKLWLNQRDGEGALTWLEYETTDIPHVLHIHTFQEGQLAKTGHELQLGSDIGQALVDKPVAASINARGDGLIVWQEGTHQILGQTIHDFALVNSPVAVAESSQALQIKLSLDTGGNGILTWVERTDCSPSHCAESHVVRGRTVRNYLPQ